MIGLRPSSPSPDESSKSQHRPLAYLALTGLSVIGILLLVANTRYLDEPLASLPSRIKAYGSQDDVFGRIDEGLRQMSAEPSTDWSKRIFQIGEPEHVDSLDPDWQLKNPTFRKEMLLQTAADSYVAQKFRDIPELLDFWKQLSLPVLRANLFRYMVLFAEGGVYADIDTECLTPIREWLTQVQWDDPNLTSVVGMEIDELDIEDKYLKSWAWSRPFQFASFVAMNKQGSPVPRRAISLMVQRVSARAESQGVIIKDIDWDLKHTKHVSWHSGSTCWTDAVLDVMRDDLQDGLNDTERWSTFARTKEPVTVGSTLVLPVNAFASGQRHSGSKPTTETNALIKHRWRGQWVKWDKRKRGRQEGRKSP